MTEVSSNSQFPKTKKRKISPPTEVIDLVSSNESTTHKRKRSTPTQVIDLLSSNESKTRKRKRSASPSPSPSPHMKLKWYDKVRKLFQKPPHVGAAIPLGEHVELNEFGQLKKQIKITDFQTFRENQELTDTAMISYFNILSKTRNDYFIFDNTTFHFLETYDFDIANLQDAFRAMLQSNEKKYTDYHKIFFPIWLHYNHWVLVVLDKQELSLTYYDSIGNTDGKNHMNHIQHLYHEMIFALNNQAKLSMEEIRVNYSFKQTEIFTHTNRLQSQGVDCGIYVCAFITFFYKNKQATITSWKKDEWNQRMKHYRIHFAACVLADQLL